MISFIAPAYNVNAYLDDFFNSFKGLEKDSFEIIFIDDKSPKDPSAFVKKYKKDFNITYVRNKKNLGLGFARNEGLKHVNKKSKHVIYIDTDDKLFDLTFIEDIVDGKITWFNNMTFDKKNEKYENKIASFGRNLFTNTIWGVAIPTKIAKENLFESRYFEDMIVNRRLVKKYGADIILSEKAIISYRYRGSGINSSKPSVKKYTAFMNEVKKLIAEDLNTYKFNIQEIYQYYWMWKKHLEGFHKSLLPETKKRYKVAFWFTGSMIRWLRIEGLVYGRGKKHAFD